MNDKIIQANSGKNFKFLDTVLHTELYKIYSMCDVAVWPSSVTISQLEAMSCGLPIIVSDVPAAVERVVYGNGFIIQHESEEQLEHYMKLLYLNQEIRMQMGEKGRNAIVEKLNWENISKRILDLISSDITD